ncbi:matrilysin-like [Anneissia japonica]|uniref:matrilysin-like n=1 Tax=Anneissia japonica TaxID=1529436 RepID=UPI0014254C84|nr:matrilysin-like [Anneissia japonica]
MTQAMKCSRKTITHRMQAIILLITELLLVFHVSCAVKVDKRSEKIQDFLDRYGYSDFKRAEAPNDITAGDTDPFRSAVERMQRFSGLEPSGQVDDETYNLMSSARCGVPDIIREADDVEGSGSGVIEPDEFVTGRKWGKTTLTYRIFEYTKDLPKEAVDDAVERAFRVWSDVSSLVFNKVESGPVDIEIHFTAIRHMDRYPFDGPGGTLAHAFQPSGWRGLGGDVHFDDSETFTVESDKGINLFQVASHEIGHALGLSHSKDSSALMAPYYKGFVAAYRLPIDDVRGIQKLYGKKTLPNPPPTYTVREPDACSKGFDAMVNLGSVLLAFRGDRLWRIRLGKRQTVLTKDILEGDHIDDLMTVPGPVDAAYKRKSDGILILFKGQLMYEYNVHSATYVKSEIRTLSTMLPSSIDAALTSSIEQLTTYLFKWDRVFVYDELHKTISNPKHITDIFPGIPDHISGAFNGNDGFYYFVKEHYVYKYSVQDKRIEDNYPQSFSKTFIGCKP